MIGANIFKFELKSYAFSTVLWVIALCVLTVLFLSIYLPLSEDVALFQNILDQFPEQFKQLTGFAGIDFTSPLGYLEMTMTYVVLIGSVQAMNLGVGMMSKERRRKTADFLLSKPVQRDQVLLSKFAAALGLIALTNILYLPVLLLSVETILAGEISLLTVLLVGSSLFCVQLFFVAVGVLAANLLPKIKSVLAVSLPVVFGFYIIGMLDGVVGEDKIRYISPFKFFDFEYLDMNHTYEWQFLLLAIAVIVGGMILARRIYISRDIAL